MSRASLPRTCEPARQRLRVAQLLCEFIGVRASTIFLCHLPNFLYISLTFHSHFLVIFQDFHLHFKRFCATRVVCFFSFFELSHSVFTDLRLTVTKLGIYELRLFFSSLCVCVYLCCCWVLSLDLQLVFFCCFFILFSFQPHTEQPNLHNRDRTAYALSSWRLMLHFEKTYNKSCRPGVTLTL